MIRRQSIQYVHSTGTLGCVEQRVRLGVFLVVATYLCFDGSGSDAEATRMRRGSEAGQSICPFLCCTASVHDEQESHVALRRRLTAAKVCHRVRLDRNCTLLIAPTTSRVLPLPYSAHPLTPDTGSHCLRNTRRGQSSAGAKELATRTSTRIGAKVDGPCF